MGGGNSEFRPSLLHFIAHSLVPELPLHVHIKLVSFCHCNIFPTPYAESNSIFGPNTPIIWSCYCCFILSVTACIRPQPHFLVYNFCNDPCSFIMDFSFLFHFVRNGSCMVYFSCRHVIISSSFFGYYWVSDQCLVILCAHRRNTFFG